MLHAPLTIQSSAPMLLCSYAPMLLDFIQFSSIFLDFPQSCVIQSFFQAVIILHQILTAGSFRGFSSTAKALASYKQPDFTSYLNNKSEQKNKNFTYFMVGSMGLLSAAGAKSTVESFLSSMAASADVLAMAKAEVKLNAIPLGSNVIVKWQGKPVFIRHRTPDEIDEANSVDIKTLRDPQTDDERVQKPEWLVMIGICTHLGCVPIGEAGDFGGWFCPCHGSHYDISGRIRRGPAPLNLEIPQYEFSDEESLLIG